MNATVLVEIVPNTNPVDEEKRKKLLEDPGFGNIFSDHMAVVHWSQDKGWHKAQIMARAPFQIDPASAVLHYGQEIFEGLKAYRSKDDRILLFRPEANARRFARSAGRLAMPELPEQLFLDCVKELVKIDAAWIPQGDDASLYLRPFMFANEAFLGVRPSRDYIFCIIASPSGAYFKGAGKPVTIWVETELSRTAPGGTGAAKCGGNYAGSLEAQAKAAEHDCDQVAFLDVVERRWVEELGGMNVFFVLDGKTLVTPALKGTILPGITRDSLLVLAKEAGLGVEERDYSFDEWQADAASGRLSEVFACGTAAVITAVGQVRYQGGAFTIADGKAGAVTLKLREELIRLQRGEANDSHGWVSVVA